MELCSNTWIVSLELYLLILNLDIYIYLHTHMLICTCKSSTFSFLSSWCPLHFFCSLNIAPLIYLLLFDWPFPISGISISSFTFFYILLQLETGMLYLFIVSHDLLSTTCAVVSFNEAGWFEQYLAKAARPVEKGAKKCIPSWERSHIPYVLALFWVDDFPEFSQLGVLNPFPGPIWMARDRS